jgi:hypothetical protein
MPVERVTYSDLRLAAEWCASYEAAGEDDQDCRAMHRVASWLLSMSIARQAAADDRALAARLSAESGVSRADVVAFLQRRRKSG